MRLILCLTLLFCLSTKAEKNVIPLNDKVHSFIQDHCIKCHGPEKDKGDRVLHEFPIKTNKGYSIDLGNSKTVHILQDVLDQLNLGEMPPKKKSITQPPVENVRHVINWLTKTLSSAHNEEDQTVIRRLNREEYRNTMNYLLGIEPGLFDPTKQFPDDDTVHGFTNISKALNISDEHLDQYLVAAEQYLNMAIKWEEPSEPKFIDITPKQWGAPRKQDQTPWMYRHYTPGKYLDVGSGLQPLSEHIALATSPKGFRGIENAGYYKIKVNAEALRRLTHPYDPKMIPTDLSRPMQLGLYVAKDREGTSAGGAQKRLRIGLYELKDHEAQDFEATVWLDKGAIPFINWENGPGPSDWWMRDVCKKYHTDIEFYGKKGQGAAEWHIVGKDLVPGRVVSDVWKGPLMRVHSFQFVGPLKKSYQSRFQKEVLGGVYNPKDVDAPKALHNLASMAFRREVNKDEVKPYLQILNKAKNDLGMNKKEALMLAFKSILVSPQFLFRQQKTAENGKLVNDAIASRLSYFLWRSMPDSDLRASSDLVNSEKRHKEAVRLLENKAHVSKLINDFMNSWLRYDKFSVMAPDKVKYQEFYRWGLKEAMRAETAHYIESALHENRPITEFLDSDYTFLNYDLARHYGIKDVNGVQFRKVKLPKDSIRGGLLGHAGIQSLSSNGVDTSPIIRGIWILENILGTPPSPPPPDVEPLDADTRGATTLKQRLEKHRKVEACADCHAKIDPYGFALENFDPIGNYRTMYHKSMRWQRKAVFTKKSKGPKVDPTSTLPNGVKLKNLNDLKKALYNRRSQFAFALTEKLMTFATGREMTFKEHAEIKRIASLKPTEEYGFRDLILEVVSSDVFIKR